MHREWVSRSDVSFFRASWIADYPDPESYLALFYSRHFTPDGPNYTRFADPVYDSLYEASLSITDDSLRYELYYRMDNLAMKHAPVVVLYYDEVVRLIHHHVHGLNRNAINLIDLKRVYFE
jgi:oligopeptide transport system substrate-binding protein